MNADERGSDQKITKQLFKRASNPLFEECGSGFSDSRNLR
jgi:hypothetical protein